MARHLEDLAGQTFGRLTVVGRVEDPRGNYWLCRCSCGGEKWINRSDALKRGAVRSCGCLNDEARAQNALSLEGERLGRLRVISRVKNQGRSATWLCRCDCGNEITLTSGEFRRGRTQSCGCLGRELQIKRQTTHGQGRWQDRSPAYVSWLNMKSRCYNPNHRAFSYYGGRGIRVCKRWLNSFENFLADMGDRPPGTTLDRYPDQDGDYEPSNCRWATKTEQQNNLRSNRSRSD